MRWKFRKQTESNGICQCSEFKKILLEQYHARSSDLFEIIEGSDNHNHPLVYIVSFTTGVNRVEVMYEVRDCAIFLYRVPQGKSVAKPGDLIGRVFSELSPEAENWDRRISDHALDIKLRIIAIFELLELLHKEDLNDLMRRE